MEDEKQLLYRIWLNACCDNNPSQVQRLLDEIGTPEEIFHTDFYKPKFAGKLKLGQRLRLDTKLDAAKRILDTCRKKKIRVLSVADTAYPEGLRQVYAPPQILYVLGDAPDFNEMLGIAVVGTRSGTGEGERFAGILGHELADNGVTIVSGMALGMDAAAHWGALEAGGTTVAVLAGGVDVLYPRENKELYQHIQTHGCIVSEQPPGTVGKPYYYKHRNRIMVGLSHGTVIVEGAAKSGTAITARLAMENNRDVFAVPGNPLNPMSELPNHLLQDGCTPLTGAMDIVEEYLSRYPEKLAYGLSQKGRPVVGGIRKDFKPVSWEQPVPQKEKRTEKTYRQDPKQTPEITEAALAQWMERHGSGEEEQQILRFLLEHGGRADYDEIADFCKIDSGMLSSMLIILQMKKAIVPYPGGQYQLQINTEE